MQRYFFDFSKFQLVITLAATGLADNGAFSTALSELVDCGFVRRYRLPGRISHDAVYQLIDNFTLFHFKFLAELGAGESGSWVAVQNAPRVNAWRGLAFERVCLEHIVQIKRALGISGVDTRQYAWRSSAGTGADGAQIDLLIERADDAANICEMKYSAGEYALTKEEHRKMLNRRERFVAESAFRGAAYITLVTTCGAARNEYLNDVHSVVTLDDLFSDG